MKRIILGALLFATPALAQQPDPVQVFTTDWQGKVIAEGHVAASAEALLRSYQAQAESLKKAQADLAAMEQSKAWVLDNWVPKGDAAK